MPMDTEFTSNVYHFTHQMMESLVKNFEGKEVGSDELNMDVLMEFYFDDFKPGDDVVLEDEGTKKGKKKKKKKSGGPKRATTAFFFYTADIRPQVKEENPGLSVGELAKIHGKMWKALSDEDKAPYLEKNKKDKERYEKEKAEYEAKNDSDE